MVSNKEAMLKICGILVAVLGFALLVQPQSFNAQASPTTLVFGIVGMALGAFLFMKSEK